VFVRFHLWYPKNILHSHLRLQLKREMNFKCKKEKRARESEREALVVRRRGLPSGSQDNQITIGMREKSAFPVGPPS
jgi:hypothetical protein